MFTVHGAYYYSIRLPTMQTSFLELSVEACASMSAEAMRLRSVLSKSAHQAEPTATEGPSAAATSSEGSVQGGSGELTSQVVAAAEVEADGMEASMNAVKTGAMKAAMSSATGATGGATGGATDGAAAGGATDGAATAGATGGTGGATGGATGATGPNPNSLSEISGIGPMKRKLAAALEKATAANAKCLGSSLSMFLKAEANADKSMKVAQAAAKATVEAAVNKIEDDFKAQAAVPKADLDVAKGKMTRARDAHVAAKARFDAASAKHAEAMKLLAAGTKTAAAARAAEVAKVAQAKKTATAKVAAMLVDAKALAKEKGKELKGARKDAECVGGDSLGSWSSH